MSLGVYDIFINTSVCVWNEICRFLIKKPLNDKVQLSTTDLLALASMKNAAKCDK